MVSTQYRLRKKSDIDFVYTHGRKAYGPLLRVTHCKGQADSTRFTVVVSQRVAKHAVDRNRIKRRIRSVVADKMVQLTPSRPNVRDIVITAQPKALTASHGEFVAELDRLFTQAKLYAGN